MSLAAAPTDTAADASAENPAVEIGHVLAHPVHGPVRIVAMRTRSVRGAEQKYVDLEVLGDQMQISVPAGGRDVVGLRPLLGRAEVEGLLEKLEAPLEVATKKVTWAHRMKTLQGLIQTGRVTDRIEIIRKIVGDSGATPSSLAERTMLREAITPLATEFALALEVSQDDARDLLMDTVARAEEAGAQAAA